jgi:hypothetical protein
MQQQPIKFWDLKPGDKFTVEYTVDPQGYAQTGKWVGLYRSTSSGRSAPFYDEMNITSVTKVPRVPKAGDQYTQEGRIGTCTLVFIDSKSVVLRDGNGTRFYGAREGWDASEYCRKWL